MEIPHVRRRVHSKVTNSGEQTKKLLLGTKPPQSYSFRSIYSRVHTKITQIYSFCSIYPRVRTKITPYDTHQPTLMSPRYSNVTTSIHSKTYIKCSQIHKSIQSDKMKSQRENSIHNKIERGKHHLIGLY